MDPCILRYSHSPLNAWVDFWGVRKNSQEFFTTHRDSEGLLGGLLETPRGFQRLGEAAEAFTDFQGLSEIRRNSKGRLSRTPSVSQRTFSGSQGLKGVLR